jgi:hypothetical protein
VALPLLAATVLAGAPAFVGSFRASWNLVDGVGVLDHIAVEGAFGLELRRPLGAPGPAVDVLGSATGAIAEGGEPSMRVLGGVAFPFRLGPAVELVPSFWFGGYRLFAGDRREGPAGRVALALRVEGEGGFFLEFAPLSLLLLPPPGDGWSRYTSHVALDVAIVTFGGRSP